jgi:hypothetical protein
MSKSCLNCKAAASTDVPILCCGACRSAVYCSKVCQRKDWKEGEHKKICKYLNVGEGAMQVRHPIHMEHLAELAKRFKEEERNLGKDGKQFFKYFTQSTFEGSQAAARKMKKILVRETRHSRKDLLFHSLYLLIRTDSEKLLWPNSPLLLLLQFVDASVLSGSDHDEIRYTPLYQVACLVDPTSSDYLTQENQLTLGRQLIEHGANVNTGVYPNEATPLHSACHSSNTTNLDFIELLLENGANPNAHDVFGHTPLLYTTMFAPGAAKFLLEWPTTDMNITNRPGASFLACVRGAVDCVSRLAGIPGIKDIFVLQQWREIEEMLVERGAIDNDTRITAVE